MIPVMTTARPVYDGDFGWHLGVLQSAYQGSVLTVLGHFPLCGEGLCIGYDSADPVSSMYSSGFDFTGGEIKKVVFDIADDVYVDVEAHLAAAMARD